MLIPRQGPYSERKEALSLRHAGQSRARAQANTRDLRHADFEEAVTWCFEVV
jgi:hypothetical protein